jgi:hypothetical protein
MHYYAAEIFILLVSHFAFSMEIALLLERKVFLGKYVLLHCVCRKHLSVGPPWRILYNEFVIR